MSEALAEKSCKHCGERRSRHVGRVFACFGGMGTVWVPAEAQAMSESSAAEKLAEMDDLLGEIVAVWNPGAAFDGWALPFEQIRTTRTLVEQFVSALTTCLAEAQEELERWRKLALFNSDRMNAAETRLAEVERERDEAVDVLRKLHDGEGYSDAEGSWFVTEVDGEAAKNATALLAKYDASKAEP